MSASVNQPNGIRPSFKDSGSAEKENTTKAEVQPIHVIDTESGHKTTDLYYVQSATVTLSRRAMCVIKAALKKSLVQLCEDKRHGKDVSFAYIEQSEIYMQLASILEVSPSEDL